MIERWYIMRALVDEDVEPEEDSMSDALSDAEAAANETAPDGVKFKVGPEVQGYTVLRP